MNYIDELVKDLNAYDENISWYDSSDKHDLTSSVTFQAKETEDGYNLVQLFAFETKDYWIEVKKEDLQEMVHDKCMDKVMGWDFYELATRPGAKDLFTKVKTIDLCYIGKIKKIENSKEK